MEQQTLQVTKPSQMTIQQIAVVLARKTDLELKEEFPVFWELLRLKIKQKLRLYESDRL